MKKLMFSAFGLSLVLFTGACAPKLSIKGQAVKIAKAEPPQGCKDVGVVSAPSYVSGLEERTYTTLKNEAAEKGGNYVRLDSVNSAGQYTATVFKCPE
jgi:hypothetical protein